LTQIAKNPNFNHVMAFQQEKKIYETKSLLPVFWSENEHQSWKLLEIIEKSSFCVSYGEAPMQVEASEMERENLERWEEWKRIGRCE